MIAGGVIFVLEVALLTYLVPKYLDRWECNRWVPARKRLCHVLSLAVSRYVTAVDPASFKPDDRDTFYTNISDVEQEIARVVQAFGAALDAQLMDHCGQLIHETSKLKMYLRSAITFTTACDTKAGCATSA